LLPGDLTEDQLDAVPVMASIDSLLVEDLTEDEDEALAELRHACRVAGHPLHDRSHANDLWIAASAVHIGARLLSADSVFVDAPGLRLSLG
jgi:predicted nucleic acid-binding protein